MSADENGGGQIGQHRVDDVVALRFLREVPGRAGLEGLVDEAAVRKRRKQEHSSGQLVAHDGVDDGDTVEAGQLVVEDRHVGRVILDLRQRRAPLVCLRHDLDLSALEEAGHAAPQDAAL